ncbi:MAG TPA: sulfatase-like hydrolase/transferase [Opitutaceae bacterium]|nr:sulfatase-like hydrolase/transferase [Opitutaceae bacterium]
MSTARPNLVFVVTDQQRFDALSSHGGLARTPNLDRLAATGADLRGHFANAPVCVPSRCSLFTGRYPHAHGVLENDSRLGSHEDHLFAALKASDYRLGYCGKNHLLAESELRGFDYLVTETEDDGSPERRLYRELEQVSLQRLSDVGSWASAAWHDFPYEATTTGVITDAALKFLDETKENDQPYFLTISISDPHVPHLAPARFAGLYPEDSIPLPPVPPHGLEGKQPRLKIKQEAQGSLRATDADRRHYLAVYSGMCSFIDEQIGRVLDAVARRSDAANTIVVFTSDHGDFCFDHNLCKKDLVLLDSLLHVPLIISWPGRVKPCIADGTLSEHIDVVPTLLELLGVPMPAGCQGKSLTPLLFGKTDRHKDEVFAEVCYAGMRNPYSSFEEFLSAWKAARADPSHPLHRTAPYNIPGEPTKCIRTREWKYIWSATGIEELYDVARDPLEWHNIAGRVDCAATLSQLRTRLGDWHIRTEDPLSPRQKRDLAVRPEWQAAPGSDGNSTTHSKPLSRSRVPDRS